MPLVAFIWFAALGILRRYIVGRKHAELALRMGEQRFRAIADYTYFWEIWVSPGGNPVWTNPAVERVTGYSADELMAMRDYPMALVYEDDREKVDKAFKSALKGSTGREMEFRLLRKDGSIVWVETAWQPIFDEKGVSHGYRISIHDIMDRKRAEEARHASEEKFRLMFETSPLGMVLCEMDGTFVQANRAYLDIIGYSNEEAMKLSYWDVTPRDYDTDEAEQLRAMKETGHYGPYEKEYIRKTGQRVPVLLNGMVIKGANGVERIWSIVEDITNRKQAEEALLESEQRFRDFFENAPIGIHIFGPDQIIIDINDAELEMIGYSRNAIVGKKTWAELIIPQQIDMFKKHWHNITAKGHVRNLEYTLVHKDGHHIDVILSASARFDKDGNVLNTRGSVLDITDRNKAMEDLRISEANYHSIFDSANDAIFVHDIENAKILSVNQKACEMFGYSQKVLEQLSVADLSFDAPPYDQAHAVQWTKKAAKEGPQLFEWICKHKTGRNFWAEINLKLAVIEGENRMLAILRNITERKQAEEERENLAKFPSENPNPVLRITRDGILLYANDASSSLLTEWDCRESQTVPDYWCQAVSEAFTSGKPKKIETEHLGRKFSFEIAPVFEADYANLYGRDITERKQAEQARHKLTQELEAKNKELESILYAASHDLKSPLVNIQGFSYELAQSCELVRSTLAGKGKATDTEKVMEIALSEDIPKALDYILASSAKMDALLSGLLDISRLDTIAISVKPIDVNAMMANVIENIKYQITKAGAKLDIKSLPACLGDISQINRVFTNLLTNALKFLDKSRPGKINIFGQSRNDYSLYCVEDNGIGIAPEHQGKIFEIFYQLEPEKRKGDGLGLTIARRIIDRHNGRIWVESEVGKGTKFFVALPNV
jgi:PAS domain S-box-containing protein